MSHAQAVKCIGKYLVGTWDQGLIKHCGHTQGFDCWVDLDFAGNWKHQDTLLDPMIVKSCADWVISYAGCPISWASKLQTITALSMTEAEYVALSMSPHDVIPMMGLLKEARAFGVHVGDTPQGCYVRCLRITVVHEKWPNFPRSALKPNTLSSIFTISENTFKHARSLYMGYRQRRSMWICS